MMATIEQEFKVPSIHAGKRLDKVAAELFSDYSRAYLSRCIETGDLLVDGARFKGRTKLKGGECLTLTATPQRGEAWDEPQAVDFEIVYEDEHLLVVDKPAGLVVHPGAGNRDRTLVNGLLLVHPGQAALPRAGIVHRLDKDTSGLLMVARDTVAQGKLSAMIGQREVRRIYLGVAEGHMIAGQDVDAPIARDRKNRTKQAIDEEGKPALTRIRVAEKFASHTLIEAQLETGRTHQIRVHMQSIGHPLVGDRRYGARGVLPTGATPELVEVIRQFKRQALHASRLQFTHPFTNQPLVLEAPLPQDLSELRTHLRDHVRSV